MRPFTVDAGCARWRGWWLLALLCLPIQPVLAQNEFAARRFGQEAGLQFPAAPASGLPVAVTTSQMNTPEGCASVADSAGNLLCYTNAQYVWDRQSRVMPNGQLSGGGTSAVQAALLLRHPSQPRQYVLCSVDDAGNQFAGGLRYSVVEIAPNGNSGTVLAPTSQLLTPPGYRVTEALTAVCHANGIDYWVVVHGFQSTEFLSYRLSGTGLAAQPVRSLVGSVHGYANPGTSLWASPDGRLLAAGLPGFGIELFDTATGQVSNARALPRLISYSLEFSPNSALLYISGIGLHQYNLSTQAVVMLGTATGTLQTGPNQRIYQARSFAGSLDVITTPNVPGTGCGLQVGATSLGGKQSLSGLPNFPNQANRPLVLAATRQAYVGTRVGFQPPGQPAGAAGQWSFGDPASGTANQAVGSAVGHRYLQVGTYLVTLTVATATGPVMRTQQVTVSEPPRLWVLPRDTLFCAGDGVLLQASAQPAGTEYRWPDGSTAPTFYASQPGYYRLRVCNAAGCFAEDSVLIRTRPCALPNIITPNGDAQN
ncbi:MAG: PKD domain-containing protein [Janthinobacterium lividum]